MVFICFDISLGILSVWIHKQTATFKLYGRCKDQGLVSDRGTVRGSNPCIEINIVLWKHKQQQTARAIPMMVPSRARYIMVLNSSRHCFTWQALFTCYHFLGLLYPCLLRGRGAYPGSGKVYTTTNLSYSLGSCGRAPQGLGMAWSSLPWFAC
jgi:hypothetical protein